MARTSTTAPANLNARAELLEHELAAACARHRANNMATVARLAELSQAAYRDAVAGFAQTLASSGPLSSVLRPLSDSLRRYLGWLGWTGWNAAHLAPALGPYELERGAQRLGFAILAYAGGRLVDDGLDRHLLFKGHRRTMVGELFAGRPGGGPEGPCAQSVVLGFAAFSFAVVQLRAHRELALADRLDRLLARILPGVLAEANLCGPVDPALYRAIVGRKAALYNMLLYRALLPPAPGRHSLFRLLYEAEFLAQLVNDLIDAAEDQTRGRMNAVLEGICVTAAPKALVDARLAGLWARAEPLPAPVRDGFAEILSSLRAPLLAMPQPLQAETAEAAVESVRRGLAWLVAYQRTTGEFPTFWSTRVDMTAPTYADSPFVTAMVLLALLRAHGGRPRPSVQHALAWLAGHRRADGLVGFFREGIDPDLDDTCLVNWILQVHRADRTRYRPLAERLATLPPVDGLLPTWMRADPAADNDADPCVGASAARFFGENLVPCRLLLEGIGRALANPSHRDGTLYYVSPAALPYFVSSLRPRLKESIAPASRRQWVAGALLARWRAGEPASAIDLAMTLAAAASEGIAPSELHSLTTDLLARQRSDGSWPDHAAFRAYNFWGSPALVTALALEALSLWVAACELRVAAPAGLHE